jgi:uncharacterized protein (DUF1684 family)
MRRCLIAMVALVFVGCASPPADVNPEYRAEIESWRANRLERLTAEDGWLTLIGLHWIEPGLSRFGSNPANEIPIDVEDAPLLAGTVELSDDGDMIVRAASETPITVNGEAVAESALRTDAAGPPDIVGVGRINFYIIERNGKRAARVKDPESDHRRQFAGIDHFPIDPALRVTATLEPYDSPQEVKIPTVVGTPTTMLAPGLLRFSVNGHSVTLEPYVGQPDDPRYFLIFRDRTSGETTYGAGRFLAADAVGSDGTTVLDFNLAYNPPCAFTPFATCPLPTPQNSLPVPIEAGEKYSGDH